MYVIRLTCATIPARVLVNTLLITLCYSIWAADPNTSTLHGYHMLMQVNTLAIARLYGNVLTLRHHICFFPVNVVT